MARPSWRKRARILSDWTLSAMLQRGMLPTKRAPAGREIILLYNSRFGWPEPNPQMPPGFASSTDLRHFHEARAVIFHIPSLGNIDRLEKPEGQLWAARWKECEAHPTFSRLADPKFMGRFDLTLSHRLDADVFNGYFNPRDSQQNEQQLRAEPRPKNELAAIFMSGTLDVSGRTRYLAELMRHMPVSSYGRLLRNQRLPSDRGRQTLLETIGRSKFTLAFENAIGEDYVTEKFYDPLCAGSVPVYLGAPNVDLFAPADDCYIDVRDFAGPRELAERLQELDADDAAYSRYLDWKRRPLRPEFLARYQSQRKDPLLRLCELIAERR